MSVMLYRAPGPFSLHGVLCEYCIVEEGEVENKRAAGWYGSPAEAEQAMKASPVDVVSSNNGEEKGPELDNAAIEAEEEAPKPVIRRRRGRPPKKKADDGPLERLDTQEFPIKKLGDELD